MWNVANWKTPVRLLGAAILLATILPRAAAAQAQTTTIIQVENPAADRPASTRLMVSGWAVDPAGTGPGVDTVQLYLGDPEAGGQALGTATYGQPRPDVARLLGDNRFTNSGFQLAVELPPGDYVLYVYAHSNTAGPDEGWAVTSVTFSASTAVRPDPEADALLGGDQPRVRTAAPPAGGTASGSAQAPAGRQSSSGFTATVDPSGGIRTTPSRNDPIPLDPIVPGMSSLLGSGPNDPELADPTGSGSGIRTSVVSEPRSGAGSGQYSTGPVTLVGGSGNVCPGPNCPANTANLNAQLQNIPPSLVRELTGYNIPGLGNSTPCVPSNGPGGCNPLTGSSLSPGAPSPFQQLQNQAAAAMQSSSGTPLVSPPVNTGPACSQYNASGQCVAYMGGQGPLGSVCLRFVGSQCVYYGSPTGAPGSSLPGSSIGSTVSSVTGVVGQPLTGSVGTTSTTGGFIPGLATTYPPGVLSPSTGTTVNTGVPSTSTTVTPSTPLLTGSPYGTTTTSSGTGICLQYAPNGVCVRSQ
ncbi:MAG TPA: hypothetical protein VFB73_14180 [Chloroflexota bacterium]|nr:hypothetical protein [Chloroflexota bacterium]